MALFGRGKESFLRLSTSLRDMTVIKLIRYERRGETPRQPTAVSRYTPTEVNREAPPAFIPQPGAFSYLSRRVRPGVVCTASGCS